MDVLLCKSDLRAALKSGRGKSRKICAIGISRARLGFGSFSGSGDRATSIVSIARSSCSAGERLGMTTLHLRAQALQSAELELLDRAFGLAKLPSDFADAAFLDEAKVNDAALSLGKLADEAEEAGAVLNELQVRLGGGFGGIVDGRSVASSALGLVGDGVCSDAKEPGGERSATPFVLGEIGEGFVEHVGREVFGGGPVPDAADNKSVDALEMKVVERVELRRVALSGLDERALVGGLRRKLGCRSSGGHRDSEYIN